MISIRLAYLFTVVEAWSCLDFGQKFSGTLVILVAAVVERRIGVLRCLSCTISSDLESPEC